jgi:ankyrin repeat domain-containing protein 17
MKPRRWKLAGILMMAALMLTPAVIAQTGDDLISAVTYQDLDKVKSLVEAGVDVNFKEERYGNTPLTMACQYNLLEIAKYLMDQGADLSLKTGTGHTPLMAAASGSEELFNLLLAKGADPLVKLENGTSAFTMLITGILMDRISLQTADKLIQAGADVDESASSGAMQGYTCLMMAARNQRPDLVRYLAEKGADVNATTADGNTPLSLAREEEDQEMVDLLLSLGAR